MAQQRKSGRGKKLFLALLVLILVGVGVGAWFARTSLSPERIRLQVEETLSDFLERPVTVERARIDIRGRIHADGIRLAWNDTPLGGDAVVTTDVDIVYGWHRIALGRDPRVVHLIEPDIQVGVDVDQLQARSSIGTEQIAPDLVLPRVVIHGGAITVDVVAAGFERRTERVTGIELKLSSRGKLRGAGQTELGRMSVLAHLNPFSIQLAVDDYDLTEELPHPFLGSVVPNWEELSPSGTVDVRLSLAATPQGGLVKRLDLAFDDARVTTPGVELRLDRVGGDASFDLEGNIQFDLAAVFADSRLTVKGRMSPPNHGPTYDIGIGVSDLRFDGPWQEAIDRIDPSIQEALNLRGSIERIDCRLFESPDRSLGVELSARMDDLGVSYAGFPTADPEKITGFDYPIRALKGTIQPDGAGGHRLLLTGIHGSADAGAPRNIAVDGMIANVTGEPDVWLRITGTDIPLDDALYRALPSSVKPIWEDLGPTAGRADTSIRIRHLAGDSTTVDVDVEVKDAACRYAAFPYPIDDIVGRLWIRGRLAVLEGFEGHHGDATVRVSGELGHPDHPDRILVQADRVAFDEDLHETLRALSDSAIDDWGIPWPSGVVDLEIEAQDDGSTNRMSGFVQLVGVEVDLESLPIDLRGLRGRVDIDGKRATLRNVEGSIAGLDIPFVAGGEISLNEDGMPEFDVDVDVARTELSPTLRQRLAEVDPTIESVWETLDPRGAIGVRASIKVDDSGAGASRLRIEALDCELTPPFLPHPVTSLTGFIELGGTTLTSKGLQGTCGEMAVRIESLSYDTAPQGAIEVALSADGLDLASETFARLPAEIRQPIEDFKPRGRIDISKLHLRRGHVAGEASWTGAGEFVLRGVRLSPIELNDYHGRISVRNARLSGSDYDLDVLLMGERVHVYNQPLREFMCEVSAQPDKLAFRRISGKLYRGVIFGDESELRCKTGSPLTYEGTVRFGGVRLKDLCEAQFPRMSALRGKAKGTISFEGAENDILALAARGKLEIDDARLFEVPIVNSLLQVLPLRRPPVFTRAGSDFRLKEGHLTLDDIFFYSTPIRLNGQGELDLEGAADVVLFPEFAPDVPSILVVSDLWQALQNQLIAFRIEGPIEDPVARVENIVTDIFRRDEGKTVRPVLPPFPVARRNRF